MEKKEWVRVPCQWNWIPESDESFQPLWEGTCTVGEHDDWNAKKQQNFLNELNEKYNEKKKEVKKLKKQLKIKSVRKTLNNGPCKEYCPYCRKLLTNWHNYREHVKTHE